MIEKEKLEARLKELEQEAREIRKELYDYEENALAEKYGDKFTCEFCRFNAVYGFSGDGWHNECGAGECTCCNARCEKYKPDNKATLYIKQTREGDGFLRCKKTNGYGQITEEDCDALKELGAYIFVDEPTEYTMKLLKVFLEEKGK
jgi:hypothetical protein